MPNLTNLGGNYSLGITNPPSSLESQGVTDPHPAELLPFTETVGTSGSGKAVPVGRPVAKWHFGMLEQREFNFLMNFVSGGPQRVYMRTRVASGSVMTYHTFRAVMNYPTQATPKPGGLWENVEFIFTDLVNA